MSNVFLKIVISTNEFGKRWIFVFLGVNLTNVLENVCQIIDITKLNKIFFNFNF